MLQLSAASAYLYHGDIDMRKGSTAWIKKYLWPAEVYEISVGGLLTTPNSPLTILVLFYQRKKTIPVIITYR
jgi:hypothetical protein